MDSSLTSLLAFFEPRRAGALPLVLATVIATEGSTYRKAGARMLIDDRGEACGLLSGGCLEGDLAEHARAVVDDGSARLIEYDLRSSQDLIWGLGLGCEGAMRILLQRVGPADGYAPLKEIAAAYAARQPLAFATVVRSNVTGWPAGSVVFADSQPRDPIAASLGQRSRGLLEGKMPPGLIEVDAGASALTAFVDAIDLPPHILILGAGPDAQPVVRAISGLGWLVTLFDHRPAYAVAEHFPGAEQVATAAADELSARINLGRFDAAVVMSHNLVSDLAYLRQLAVTPLPYIGLLGPAPRRQRILAELGAEAPRLDGRLRGPVGLDIGARTPEAIALAIVAEIHAVLSGRSGQSFSRTAEPTERSAQTG